MTEMSVLKKYYKLIDVIKKESEKAFGKGYSVPEIITLKDADGNDCLFIQSRIAFMTVRHDGSEINDHEYLMRAKRIDKTIEACFVEKSVDVTPEMSHKDGYALALAIMRLMAINGCADDKFSGFAYAISLPICKAIAAIGFDAENSHVHFAESKRFIFSLRDESAGMTANLLIAPFVFPVRDDSEVRVGG